MQKLIPLLSLAVLCVAAQSVQAQRTVNQVGLEFLEKQAASADSVNSRALERDDDGDAGTDDRGVAEFVVPIVWNILKNAIEGQSKASTTSDVQDALKNAGEKGIADLKSGILAAIANAATAEEEEFDLSTVGGVIAYRAAVVEEKKRLIKELRQINSELAGADAEITKLKADEAEARAEQAARNDKELQEQNEALKAAEALLNVK